MKEKLEGRQLAMNFENFVNVMCNDEAVTEFVTYITCNTHRTLQQKMMGVFLKCIKEWSSKKDFQYDLRNEATIILSKKIMKAIEDQDYLPFI